MIGGLGPESTVDYYSMLASYRARKPDGESPHVVINSLAVDRGIAMLDAGRLDELADYLAAAVESLSARAPTSRLSRRIRRILCSMSSSAARRFLCSASCAPPAIFLDHL